MGEAGFSLLELLVCVALLVAGCVVAIGVLPTLAHGSQQSLLRDAATTIARTEIERALAATAYYPASGFTPNHAYALNARATYETTASIHRVACGGATLTTDVPMTVTDAYDPVADVVTAIVVYPRNACDAQSPQETVVLSAQLAPSALSATTRLTTTIDDPAQQ